MELPKAKYGHIEDYPDGQAMYCFYHAVRRALNNERLVDASSLTPDSPCVDCYQERKHEIVID